MPSIRSWASWSLASLYLHNDPSVDAGGRSSSWAPLPCGERRGVDAMDVEVDAATFASATGGDTPASGAATGAGPTDYLSAAEYEDEDEDEDDKYNHKKKDYDSD